MKLVIRYLLCLLLVAVPVHANQQGTMVRQAPVFADASSASRRVADIRAGAQVTLFERRGGWQEIYSEDNGIVGWVRVFQVRRGDLGGTVITDNKEDSRGFLSGLAALSRKASGFFSRDSGVTSSSTATIGVRGLSETEIKSAQADFDELEKMKAYSSNRSRMKGFKKAGGLQSYKVPYISGAKQ